MRCGRRSARLRIMFGWEREGGNNKAIGPMSCCGIFKLDRKWLATLYKAASSLGSQTFRWHLATNRASFLIFLASSPSHYVPAQDWKLFLFRLWENVLLTRYIAGLQYFPYPIVVVSGLLFDSFFGDNGNRLACFGAFIYCVSLARIRGRLLAVS